MAVASRTDELLARYREIDQLMGVTWASPEFRRWQAATADAMRKTLGFHPSVVEFAGLRFRAGPVNVVSRDELGAIPAEQHDARMRQDLAEAKRLLRRALGGLGVDADAAPVAPPADPLIQAIRAAGDPAGGPGALEAAARLRQALASAQPAWAEVGPALGVVLEVGLPAARLALAEVCRRLADLR